MSVKQILAIRIFFGLCIWLLSGHAYSQYNMDFGINLGASNYLGEMGGTSDPGKGTSRKNFVSDLKINQTKFAGGAWFRYKVHPLLAVKANLMYLRIAGADSLSDYPNRKGRNLHFRNDIFELTVQGEYHFFGVQDITNKGKTRIDFGSYIFIGGGMFYNNPKAFYLTEWYALQPLGTEGQGRIQKIDDNGVMKDFKKYKRIQANVLGGLGFSYTILRKWRVGWELGVRKTFTDYLDDASTTYVDPSVFDDGTEEGAIAKALANQSANASELTGGVMNPGHYKKDAIRGNPDDKDWYMFTAATLGYVIRGKSNFYKTKYKLITGAQKRRTRKTRAKF
mgnify:CR=1 FL=1